MSVKDFFAGLLFLGVAGYFLFQLITDMPLLFVETTTTWQYFVAFFRVALIIFVFNLGLTFIKKFFVGNTQKNGNTR